MELTHCYAQLDAQGIVVALTQVHEAIDAPQLVSVAALDAALLGQRYLPASGAFEPVAAAPAVAAERKVSRKAFLSRFTDAEAIDIDLASLGANRRAAGMRRYLSKINAAQFIDLDEEETRAGVQALEAGTLLAAGRAAQILDAAIEDKEKP